MNQEYIEREVVLNIIGTHCYIPDERHKLMNKVEETPAADVATVIHGEWIQIKEPLGWKDIDCVMCSACEDKWIMDKEYDLDFYKEHWKHCPFCGAKMDREN